MHTLIRLIIHTRQIWGWGGAGFVLGSLYAMWLFGVGFFDENWRWR